MPRKPPKVVVVTSLLLGVIVVGLWAIGIPRGSGRAVASARSTIPVIEQFERLFPGSDHFISYYTGTHGPPTWNSHAGLYGRYVLTMQMPIRFNLFWRDRIIWHGDSTFYLREIKSISPQANGTSVILYGPTHLTFGLPEWKRVVDAGGDLSVLGVKMTKDAKVLNFDEHWRSG